MSTQEKERLAQMNISARTTLEAVYCCTCGTPFGVEQHLLNKLRENGREFYCPNGHNLCYGASQLEILREKLADTEHRRQQTKAALTRLTNRVAFGVCPCCHRHFDDLQRHMATKHPEFLRSQDGVGESPDHASLQKLLAEKPADLLSVPEAARLKNVNEQTVRVAIRKRRLPAIMVGSRFKLSRHDVERWKVRGYKEARNV